MSVAPGWDPHPAADSAVVNMQNPECNHAAGIMLGEELRRHRQRRNMTLKEAALVIRGSTSKVSRLERGESPPKQRDVMDLASHYGLTREELAVIDQLLVHALNQEWYEQFADVTPDYLRRLIQFEGRAEKIQIFENQVVPGLLQTPAYARAMVKLFMPVTPTGRVVDRIVALRMRRQFILDQSLRRLDLFLDETVLYRRRGSNEVMREQLQHLLKAADADKVCVRLIGKDCATPPHPITHVTFPNGAGESSEVAYVEMVSGAVYVTQKKALDNYRRTLTTLRHHADELEVSMEKLRKAIDGYGG
ncbi:helix-turn-helix transcriptional regulator [Streptomyces sp. WAC01526]|uniref:helix-turn-helix domain-containing protein n=1 Tax=Streptomyces sp. WAC01526 TaxID=2588709 RepID=UPI001652022B|nr:helix-turn-helix transcriptional regulator [Streptomyces sp. WAC01526]